MDRRLPFVLVELMLSHLQTLLLTRFVSMLEHATNFGRRSIVAKRTRRTVVFAGAAVIVGSDCSTELSTHHRVSFSTHRHFHDSRHVLSRVIACGRHRRDGQVVARVVSRCAHIGRLPRSLLQHRGRIHALDNRLLSLERVHGSHRLLVQVVLDLGALVFRIDGADGLGTNEVLTH